MLHKYHKNETIYGKWNNSLTIKIKINISLFALNSTLRNLHCRRIRENIIHPVEKVCRSKKVSMSLTLEYSLNNIMAYNNVVNNGIIKINGGSIFSFGIPGKPSPTSDILHGNSFRKSYLFTELKNNAFMKSHHPRILAVMNFIIHFMKKETKWL